MNGWIGGLKPDFVTIDEWAREFDSDPRIRALATKMQDRIDQEYQAIFTGCATEQPKEPEPHPYADNPEFGKWG